MHSQNSNIFFPYRLVLILTDKMNLKGRNKYIALWNLSIYYTWKNIKKSCKNTKLKISGPKWNIQHCIEYVIKTHGAIVNNPPIQTYINKTENRITFKVETE